MYCVAHPNGRFLSSIPQSQAAASYPRSVGVNAAGALDYDFKVRVIARSRSTLGSSCVCGPRI